MDHTSQSLGFVWQIQYTIIRVCDAIPCVYIEQRASVNFLVKTLNNEWKKQPQTVGVCLHGTFGFCFGSRCRCCYQITFYVLQTDRNWTPMVLTACVWPSSGEQWMDKCVSSNGNKIFRRLPLLMSILEFVWSSLVWNIICPMERLIHLLALSLGRKLTSVYIS